MHLRMHRGSGWSGGGAAGGLAGWLDCWLEDGREQELWKAEKVVPKSQFCGFGPNTKFSLGVFVVVVVCGFFFDK